jgi:hypothetical protein
MKAMSNAEFADAVTKIAGPAKAFQPVAYYDADGDCIEFIAKPDPFYAERIDELVTVYYSQASKEIVGSLIKGISKFLPKVLKHNPGFMIAIQDGKIRLEHIFLAHLWMRPSHPTPTLTYRKTYEKLIAVAGESKAEAEMGLAAV